MPLTAAVGETLKTVVAMFWDVLWPLVLGFGLSAVVQAFVSHRTWAHSLPPSPSPASEATRLHQ
jgi:uncharacterized protein